MECIRRKRTKKIRVGGIFIGGGESVSVQSMTNTDTRDVASTTDQVRVLTEEGCDIIRLAVPDDSAADSLKSIKRSMKIPLVADIHFDYRLAIASMENGADKIRINPGNIGDIGRVKKVVDVAKQREIPIRIGVNAGSLEKNLIAKYGVTAHAMVESVLGHVRILEGLDFGNIIISLKSSSVPMTIAAYREISERIDYPLHIGVTEAGTLFGGTIKSCVGLGCLLAEGIGDTIRVSLTGDPREEIRVGYEILKSLGIKKQGIEIISCPTCGRCRIDLIKIAQEVERRLMGLDKTLKVAVMGCAVNGPGEAKEADIGIAGGEGEALLFKKGEIIKKVPQEEVVDVLVKEVLGM